MKLFNATDYMVKKSKQLKLKYGILPEIPAISKGKVLTKEVKEIVRQFFERDDVSRICPGKKDCISIRNIENGQKELVQKRLILMNLKEAYTFYKNNPDFPDIGFSTFCNLRPKSCILAGAYGTHTVCVCTYHQNVKLQASSLGLCNIDYKILMSKSVCDMSNRKCMMRTCVNCPGEKGIHTFLSNLENLKDMDDIIYKQWVTVDRCNLIEKAETITDYISSLSTKVTNLTRHHYISIAQSKFLKDLKDNLKENEIIILLDFSENYSFIIQDEVQGYHWENSQCTVHPFVIYHAVNDGKRKIIPKSFCFLSPELKHNTVMVYTFLSVLIPYLKSLLPKISKIYYFSDGCAGQYKNKFNFSNICFHKSDFGIECEWHFFATSHGKSPCDGIGGAIKRGTTKASLQRPFKDQIITPEQMFEFCKSYFKEIKFFFIRSSDVKEKEAFLETRFEKSLTITGTQKLHKFVPLSYGQIKVFETSDAEEGEDRQIIIQRYTRPRFCPPKPECGTYVICTYNNQKWVGFVNSIDEEFQDYKIQFLHPQGISKYYYYPEVEDTCMIDAKDIKELLSTPSLNAGTSRIQYIFSKREIMKMNIR
jgi:hypothetical protein